ncbi:MAG TPA: hypothetical protein PLX03_00335, partial [Candidatus Hydrogenedentes bacterium]|nr:hypothetical protein [Candidatus Hydrogenedentota bacterium]
MAAWAQPPVATTDQTARYAEPIAAILERGFPQNWFVCGPFPADVPGGIIRAAAEGATVLGQRDFMSPLGGVAVTRPVPLLGVGGPESVWQSAQVASPVLDFSSLFQGREEGIAYGAFYLTADAETPVFFESHTPFGARWWVNDTPYRDIRQGSLAETGADRFLVIFPPGQHLVLFEAPLADLDALTRALDTSIPALLNREWSNRSMLPGANGWETTLRLRPAVSSATVYLDTSLRDTGLLGGISADPRRLFNLTVWNHGDVISPAGNITIQNGALSAQIELPGLQPYQAADLALPVPFPAEAETVGGQPITLTAQVSGADPVTYTVTLPDTPLPRNPRTWIAAGALTPARNAGELERRRDLLASLALLQGRWRGGGFYVTALEDVLPFFAARPDLLDLAFAGSRQAFLSVAAADDAPDPRVATAETLRRDAAGTQTAALALLGLMPESALFAEGPAPDPAGMAMLSSLGIRGTCLTGGYRFQPQVSAQPVEPDRWFVRRRVEVSLAPDHEDAMADFLRKLRRQDNRAGWGPSLGLIDLSGGLPDWLEPMLSRLPSAYPPAQVNRLAPDAYFAAVPPLLTEGGAFPAERLALVPAHTGRIGLLVRYPAFQVLWKETEALLNAGETAMTLCGLAGAKVPLAELDWSWRVLAARGSWWRMAGLSEPEDLKDSLADLGAVRDLVIRRAAESLDALGRQVNTMGGAPGFGKIPGTRAVLAFNPAPTERTAIAEIMGDITGTDRPAVVDAFGEPVPFTLDIREIQTAEGVRQEGRFRFLARGVPATGYDVFFIRPGGTPDSPVQDSRPVLESDRIILEFDPGTGNLKRYADKQAGWTFEAPDIGAIYALNNDPARSADGAELWTSGPPIRPGQPRFTARRTEWFQEIQIEQPFLEGTLVRRWQLSQEDPWPACEITLTGADTRGRAVFLSSPVPESGVVPIAGGSGKPVVGRRHARPDLYRTGAKDDP